MIDPSLTALFAAMEEPGHLLVFVDDGGTPSRPIPTLVRDFAVYAAVLIPSDSYSLLVDQAELALRQVAPLAPEFHATEVVNPKRGSPFFGRPVADRVQLIQRWGDLVVRYSRRVPYGYIGADQHRKLQEERPALDVPRDHHAALRLAFYSAMFKWVRQWSPEGSLIVVEDERNRRTQCSEAVILPTVGALNDSVHYLPSHLAVGIQLADLVAYAINRQFHSRWRKSQGKPMTFDAAITQLLDRLHGQLYHVFED
jgi:hypothetical protein